jgi:hypothetical protein
MVIYSKITISFNIMLINLIETILRSWCSDKKFNFFDKHLDERFNLD